ncbi:hypothetical protein J1N35_015146 [Gossypium stocksii]|uniref:Cytochrome P450 n=1 Tax=Gossypium stocksii TaxID=47602 RepID=A0A9D4A9L1_9ROSI|nr:hypothetical protein J1N35_015146 [Gossypium stocksii]
MVNIFEAMPISEIKKIKQSYFPLSITMLLIPFLLLLPSLLIFINKLTTKRGKLPPGPPKLPILGNLHQLGPSPHRSTWQLSKKHGPIMLLQLRSTPTLVVSSAEAAKEVLKTHDLECCSRPPLTGPKRTLLSYPTDITGEMRKICVAELFSMKRVQSFQSVREEEVDLLIESVSESATSANPVDLSKYFFSLTASIIFRIAFGKQFQESQLDNHELQKVVFEAETMLGSFCASDFFPYVGKVIDWFTHFHRKLEISFHELDAVFQQVIDDHLDSGPTKHDEEDIVNVLLRMEKDQTQNDSIQLTKDHIKAILMDIFVAGIHTGAITMIWAMTELVRKPTAMKKAQNEIRSCIRKKGKLTENYVIVLLAPRETISQIKIGNYDICPKTRIAGQHIELLPFGAGRRICPGMNMGMAVLELALANLLYCFYWKLPSGMTEMDIDMEEEVSITVGKKFPLMLMPINYNMWEDDEIKHC